MVIAGFSTIPGGKLSPDFWLPSTVGPFAQSLKPCHQDPEDLPPLPMKTIELSDVSSGDLSDASKKRDPNDGWVGEFGDFCLCIFISGLYQIGEMHVKCYTLKL